MAIDNGIKEVDESFIFFGYCSLIIFIVLLGWSLPCYFVFHNILGIRYQCRKPTKDETNLAHTVNSNSQIDLDSKSSSSHIPTTEINHQKSEQQNTNRFKKRQNI
eukprot:139914_1